MSYCIIKGRNQSGSSVTGLTTKSFFSVIAGWKIASCALGLYYFTENTGINISTHFLFSYDYNHRQYVYLHKWIGRFRYIHKLSYHRHLEPTENSHYAYRPILIAYQSVEMKIPCVGLHVNYNKSRNWNQHFNISNMRRKLYINTPLVSLRVCCRERPTWGWGSRESRGIRGIPAGMGGNVAGFPWRWQQRLRDSRGDGTKLCGIPAGMQFYLTFLSMML